LDTVPSLDDLEKDWQENPQRSARPKLLPVDFRSPLAAVAQATYSYPNPAANNDIWKDA
jgi:hypothetical protein